MSVLIIMAYLSVTEHQPQRLKNQANAEVPKTVVYKKNKKTFEAGSKMQSILIDPNVKMFNFTAEMYRITAGQDNKRSL